MQLELRCVEGAVDLLAAELGPLVIRSKRSSVDCCVSDLQEIIGCRLYSSAAIPLPGDPGDATFLEPLQHLEPMAFRVGASSASVRRELIAAVERLGWWNDPRAWAINLTETTSGWVAGVGSLHWVRRFGRLERLPWATNPVVAEVLVRLAKIRGGQVVLDPFCGSGTVLAAARARAVGVRVVGSDRDAGSVEMARRNLGDERLGVGFAEELKHPDGSVDRVVANLPFGKRVGSHQDNLRLYPAALGEIARVLTRDGRAVLMTEDKRLLRSAVAGTPGVKIVKERLLRFNGATPTVFVVMPTRR